MPPFRQETKIGVTVNKLRNNDAKEVADLAKELVRKWKADVGRSGSKKSQSGFPFGDSPSTLYTDARILFCQLLQLLLLRPRLPRRLLPPLPPPQLPGRPNPRPRKPNPPLPLL